MEAEIAEQTAREVKSPNDVSSSEGHLPNGAKENLASGAADHQKRILVIAGSDSSGGA